MQFVQNHGFLLSHTSYLHCRGTHASLFLFRVRVIFFLSSANVVSDNFTIMHMRGMICLRIFCLMSKYDNIFERYSTVKYYFNTDMTLDDILYSVLCRPSPGANHCQASNVTQPMYTCTHSHKQCSTVQAHVQYL